MADVIEYKIHGDDMQTVEVELDSGEAVRAEAGTMMFMEDGIEMETGASGGLMGGLKRMVTGKGFFITSFAHQRKGRSTALMAGIVTAILGLSPVQAEPYAAVADPPSKGSEFHDLWKMRLSNIQVPERATVSVPPYPGAKIIKVMKPGEPDAAGPRNTPKIIMLTTDVRQKVAAFYKQALQGWKQGGDQRNTFFWTDSDVFALGPIAYRDVPSVVLRDLGPMNFMEKSLMPDAKALITIIYKPVKP